jgi:hypothetical protein
LGKAEEYAAFVDDIVEAAAATVQDRTLTEARDLVVGA